jgi:outer membrane protein
MKLFPATALAAALAGLLALGSPEAGSSQAAGAPRPEPKRLTLEGALASGLARDPGVLAASLDARAAEARAADARLRMLPSLTLSTGYTKLSAEPSPSPSATGNPVVDGVVNALMAEFAGAPSDSKDLRLDLQYPVFAGFRIKEAAAIAKYQALGKAQAAELSRRALAFEIKRAYWESSRARANADALKQALDLESVIRDETTNLAAQGMASEADRLSEDARFEQATLALDDAAAGRELALLALASLVGDQGADTRGETAYVLATEPGSVAPPAALAGLDPADGDALVAFALARRSETRAASIAVSALEAAKGAAEAELYPSLAITGSVSYADPDPRLFPAVDKFNLSWSVGARLRYDLGGVPGALERGKAAEADLAKARADLARARNGIALDARRSGLALRKSRDSLELTKALVAQAEEGARVAQRKFDLGMAKRSELLQAQVALVRARLMVTSKTLDVEIALADLSRALGLDE